MATVIPQDPRIVCVDCVQLVRVVFVELQPISNEVLVGTECCTRRLGTIHHDKFERLEVDGRKLTTNDIRPLEPHRVINRALENIEQDTKRLNWARWALEGKETMTKKVRIENADTSSHKVKVFTEDLVDGQWVRNPVPLALDYPTALGDGWVHSTRRLVVEESSE